MLKVDWKIITSPGRSLLILLAMLVALTAVLMFDDVIFYLIFERLFGWKSSWLTKLGVGVIITIPNLVLAFLIMKAFNEKPRTGAEGMIGEQTVVVRVASDHCWVKVHGELWRAQSHEMPAVGEKVVVRSVKGLTLEVERLNMNANGGKL